MLTLGIETSCDETSVAVVDSGRRVLSNVILSQAIHSKFGGVIPEVASREHLKAIVSIYREALKEAGIDKTDIDLVAATMGPGLVGPLLVGLTFAKGIAWSNRLPFVPVNHLEGHLAANLLAHPEMDRHHLCLIVSGGHTLLVEVKKFGEYNLLGSSRDDAAGEAFDKVAKLMGLGYPGGAALERLAHGGKPDAIAFPRPMIKREGYEFSFSGLKTAVSLYLDKLSEQEKARRLPDIAASFQEAVVDLLVEKTARAAAECGLSTVALSGGVAANSRLREKMADRLERANCRLLYPPTSLCTDNGAMIAAAGFFRFEEDGPGELIANAIPNLKLQ